MAEESYGAPTTKRAAGQPEHLLTLAGGAQTPAQGTANYPTQNCYKTI